MEAKAINRLRLDPEKIILYRGLHLLLADRYGMISSNEQGYFYEQTRFISKHELHVQGERIKPASCNAVEPHSSVSYSTLRSPAGCEGAPKRDPDSGSGEVVEKGIEIQVNTYIGGGYHQDVHVINHTLASAAITLKLIFAADFADLKADFADLKDVESGKREQSAPIERKFETMSQGKGQLTFSYQHPDINHATRIRVAAPCDLGDEGASLRAKLILPPRKPEIISIDISSSFLGETIEPWYGLDGRMMEHSPAKVSSSNWLNSCVRLESSNPGVQDIWDRAIADLGSLHSLQGENGELFTPMGGIPKYAALFGRDALMASIQSALLNPETLKGSLLSVGKWTAAVRDDRYDAQAGRCYISASSVPLLCSAIRPLCIIMGIIRHRLSISSPRRCTLLIRRTGSSSPWSGTRSARPSIGWIETAISTATDFMNIAPSLAKPG
ncbi:MAG: hypothetical protein J2P49_04640 [Methylocapsa sp.]|nr:hypothetical protein [Methylocapsa sp.]